MNPITSAQAFAVTLEKEGGSPSPTMDQMYVMGKI
jgi:anti-sigma-K factor RskA